MTSGSFGRQPTVDDFGQQRPAGRTQNWDSDESSPRRYAGSSVQQQDEAAKRTTDFKPPRPPLRDAPARFGAAGISAGEDRRYKTDLQDTPDLRRGEPPDKLAQGLGWFSIGLGLLEVMNAEGLGRWLGTENGRGVIRTYGFREIANGIAILAQKDSQARSPWLWGRVAGDGLDLYSLARARHDNNPRKGNVNIAIGAVLGVTMLDIMAAGLLAER